MPDFLPRQRGPLASCQSGTDDLPTRFGPNVRRWGTGGSQTHPWREPDSNHRFRRLPSNRNTARTRAGTAGTPGAFRGTDGSNPASSRRESTANLRSLWSGRPTLAPCSWFRRSTRGRRATMDLPGILIGRRLANQEGEARKITVSNGKQSGPRIGMDSLAMRGFVGIDLGRDPLPAETQFHRLRTLVAAAH